MGDDPPHGAGRCEAEGRLFAINARAIVREQTDGTYHYDLGVKRSEAREQRPPRDPRNIPKALRLGVNEDVGGREQKLLRPSPEGEATEYIVTAGTVKIAITPREGNGDAALGPEFFEAENPYLAEETCSGKVGRRLDEMRSFLRGLAHPER